MAEGGQAYIERSIIVMLCLEPLGMLVQRFAAVPLALGPCTSRTASGVGLEGALGWSIGPLDECSKKRDAPVLLPTRITGAA